jgi:hypothetical protein
MPTTTTATYIFYNIIPAAAAAAAAAEAAATTTTTSSTTRTVLKLIAILIDNKTVDVYTQVRFFLISFLLFLEFKLFRVMNDFG